jgi:hypothetical protein
VSEPQSAEAVRAGDRACGPGIPEGLEPLAVWDSTEPGWCDEHWRERTEWAVLHLDAEFTYRAEFYLIDAPFAVVHKFARNGDGRKWAANGEAMTEPPAILPLTELPPAHLVR